MRGFYQPIRTEHRVWDYFINQSRTVDIIQLELSRECKNIDQTITTVKKMWEFLSTNHNCRENVRKFIKQSQLSRECKNFYQTITTVEIMWEFLSNDHNCRENVRIFIKQSQLLRECENFYQTITTAERM